MMAISRASCTFTPETPLSTMSRFHSPYTAAVSGRSVSKPLIFFTSRELRDVLESKVHWRAFGKKVGNGPYRRCVLRVKRLNTAQQNVGINQNAHLSAIGTDRLTVDGFVGQNRCAARMAFCPRSESSSTFSRGQDCPDTFRGDDRMESFVYCFLYGTEAPWRRASWRMRSCSGLSSIVIGIPARSGSQFIISRVIRFGRCGASPLTPWT